MPISEVHVCQCAHCQGLGEHPDKKVHKQINLLVSRLDEQQRRWFVAVEANRHGYGGVRLLSQITGMDEKTIERGSRRWNRSDRTLNRASTLCGWRTCSGRKKDRR